MITFPQSRPHPAPEDAERMIAAFLEQHDSGTSTILRDFLAALTESGPAFAVNRLGRMNDELAAAALALLARRLGVPALELPDRPWDSLVALARFSIAHQRTAAGRHVRDFLLSAFNGVTDVALAAGAMPAEQLVALVHVLRALFVPPRSGRLYDAHIRSVFTQLGAESFFFRPINSQ